MTTFDEREQAFESQFEHDQELLFRIQARRAKLFGLWAAQRLGHSGGEAEAYARRLVDLDVDRGPGEALVQRVCDDFAAKGVDVSRHRVEREAEALLQQARQQVMAE